MFTSISMFFATINRVFNILYIITGVGEKYALHFEVDADLKLDAKKALLKEQSAL